MPSSLHNAWHTVNSPAIIGVIFCCCPLIFGGSGEFGSPGTSEMFSGIWSNWIYLPHWPRLCFLKTPALIPPQNLCACWSRCPACPSPSTTRGHSLLTSGLSLMSPPPLQILCYLTVFPFLYLPPPEIVFFTCLLSITATRMGAPERKDPYLPSLRSLPGTQ